MSGMVRSRRAGLGKAVTAMAALAVGMTATGALAITGASPAFAAVGTFLSPANGFTFPVNAAGNPTRQDVKTTNFPIGLVFIEACDGKSPAARGYDAALDCDNTTAPAPVSSTGPTFVENFTTANADRAAMAFRGAGGSGTYNCLAPEDVKPGTGPKADGSVTPIGPMTKNGNVIDLSVPSWSNCQIRVSSNNASNTQDQAYITYVLPNTPVRIAPAISAVTAVPTTSTVGASVTLTATVTGTAGPTPTGTVSFNSAGTAIATCSTQAIDATGKSTCTTTTLPAGTDSLTAVYSGDGVYGTVTSTPSSFVVSRATPTVTLTSVPATRAGTGSTVTFTATVAGGAGAPSPTGTVTFTSGGPLSGACAMPAPIAAGVATCTTSFAAAGTPTVTAAYSGDPNYLAGTPATEAFTVVTLPKADVAVSTTPAAPTYGQPVTITATVTAPIALPGSPPSPGGTVSFTSGANPVAGCTAPVAIGVDHTAKCTPSPPLPTGSTPVTATYSGDQSYSGNATTVTVAVAKATPAVSVTSPTPTAKQGQPVTFNVSVTGPMGTTPGGLVDLTVGGQAIDAACTGVTLAAGAATCTTTKLPAGTDSISAAYKGDANFATATSAPPLTVTVSATFATTTTVAAPTPVSPQLLGTAVTIVATVAPSGTHDATSPTGTVRFTVNGTPISGCSAQPVTTASGSSTATCTTSSLPEGTDSIAAAYAPDAASNYLASDSTTAPVTYTITKLPITIVPLPSGYVEVGRDGGVFTFGGAGFFGSVAGQAINGAVVGLAETVDQKGYWLVGTDGGVYSFGDAVFFGSLGGQHLNAPIVGITATIDGGGYWLVASDGGVFAFGDASFLGAMGGQHLNAPVVGMAARSDNSGYWLAAADGGVFAFAKAGFFGSLGGQHLNAPVVGISGTADDGGYWLGAADGGVFNYGDAAFAGSAGGTTLNAPVVAISAAAEGGYRLGAADGGVFNYGGAPFFGSLGGKPLNAPVSGLTSTGGLLLIISLPALKF